MTIYNVHIYREMRLVYGGIEAGTHEESAAIARDKPTDEADSIDECDGETFAALVDVQGDEEHEHSLVIDFEAERERKAASRMLAALTWLLDDLADAGEDRNPETGEAYDSVAFARAAKAAAEPVVPRSEPVPSGLASEPAGADVAAVLAGRCQIAPIWSVGDVQSVRPDLTDGQAWEVLQAAGRQHDASIGITWEVLRSHADGLFGDAPASTANV
jgi:hypothetical protein